MSNGAIDIQAERCRQIAVEGWTTAGDDEKGTGELMRAADCYYRSGLDGWGRVGAPEKWPWDSRWWKPKTAREDLVRAGALYLAEAEKAERLRVSQRPSPSALRTKAATCARIIDFLDKNGRLPIKEERQKMHIGAGKAA